MFPLLAPRFSPDDFSPALRLHSQDIEELSKGYAYHLFHNVYTAAEPGETEREIIRKPGFDSLMDSLMILIGLHFRMLRWRLMDSAKNLEEFLDEQVHNRESFFRQFGLFAHEPAQVQALQTFYLRFLVTEKNTFLHPSRLLRAHNPEPEAIELRAWLAAEDTSQYESFDQAVLAVRDQYQRAVSQGTEQLKQAFWVIYAHTALPELFVKSEQHRLSQLLFESPLPESGTVELTGKPYSVETIRQMRADVQAIISGDPPDFFVRYSLRDLAPDNSDFLPESYLHYLSWLTKGNYRIPALSSPQTNLRRPYLLNHPLKWIAVRPEPNLKALHHFLLLEEFIPASINWSEFEQHFTGTSFEPIQWRSQNTSLIYLFRQLIDHHFLPAPYYEDLHLRLVAHFLDREGKPFKPRSLQTVIAKKILKPRMAPRIDAFLEQLQKGI